jgi:hypothetical protein
LPIVRHAHNEAIESQKTERSRGAADGGTGGEALNVREIESLRLVVRQQLNKSYMFWVAVRLPGKAPEDNAQPFGLRGPAAIGNTCSQNGIGIIF